MDVCQIAPKIYLIYSLVGVSHFTKYHNNLPVTI